MGVSAVKQAFEGISVARIRAHIQALEGVRHPQAAPETLLRAEAYIYAALEGLRYEMFVHSFEEDGCEYHNILATNPGRGRPEERMMVLAHFDTVKDSPGADDNASGVAAMLELARVLRPFRFECSLQFVAVNLEERGPEGSEHNRITRGSLALARHARKNGWRIVGVADLEAIAYAGEDIPQKAPAGLPIEFRPVGDFIAVVGNEASRELVEGFMGAIQRYQVPLPCLPLVVPSRGEMIPDTRRSDHAPFWDNDYPAIMITDTANFRSPHYHMPSDTLETLNLAFVRHVAQATGGLAVDMAGLVGGVRR